MGTTPEQDLAKDEEAALDVLKAVLRGRTAFVYLTADASKPKGKRGALLCTRIKQDPNGKRVFSAGKKVREALDNPKHWLLGVVRFDRENRVLQIAAQRTVGKPDKLRTTLLKDLRHRGTHSPDLHPNAVRLGILLKKAEILDVSSQDSGSAKPIATGEALTDTELQALGFSPAEILELSTLPVDRDLDTLETLVIPTVVFDHPILERLVDCLEDAGVPDIQRRYDPDAFVLSKGINSESEQKALIRATIGSADRYAAITSYGIRPLSDTGELSETLYAIFQSLALRQSDPDFTFTFLYNKSDWMQNLVVGQRTTLSAKDEVPWRGMLEAYNALAVERGDPPLTRLEANVYFVAAEASGPGGSHHNKFCINDRGFVATLGASIGNKSKPNWLDSGNMALSEPLAASQRDYFCDILLESAGDTCRLVVDAENGKLGRIRLDGPDAIRTAMTDHEPSSPHDKETGEIDVAIRSALQDNALDDAGSRAGVIWLQNPGTTTTTSSTEKPIGRVLFELFSGAKAGDSIALRNCAMSKTIRKWITAAIQRGADVRFMAPVNKSDSAFYKGIGKLTSKIRSVQSKTPAAGTFTFRVVNPDQESRDLHDYDPEERGVVDHGKVYVFRLDGSECVVSGTHNLDGQSFLRSHENAMVIQADSPDLSYSLFDELWRASPPLGEDEVELLAEEARRYHGFKAKPFGVPPNPSRLRRAKPPALEPKLREKLGLPTGED